MIYLQVAYKSNPEFLELACRGGGNFRVTDRSVSVPLADNLTYNTNTPRNSSPPLGPSHDRAFGSVFARPVSRCSIPHKTPIAESKLPLKTSHKYVSTYSGAGIASFRSLTSKRRKPRKSSRWIRLTYGRRMQPKGRGIFVP